MTRENQLSYLRRFVSEGISIENGYKLIYASEEDIREISADEDFMAEMLETNAEVTLRAVESYASKVKASEKPADALKRLTQINPNVFTDDASNVEITGNLVINKVRVDQE